MNESKTFPDWSLFLLHLAPGFLLLLGFLLLAPLFWQSGLPVSLAAVTAILLIILPFEWGFLLWQGKRTKGKWTLAGVIGYTDSIPRWQYFVFVPFLALWGILSAGLLFYLFENQLHTALMKSLPAWMDVSNRASPVPVWILFVPQLLVIGILAPLTEELYFRGFLLPRMEGLKNWSPFVHSLLFSLQHFLEPYAILSRLLAILPVVWLVRRKRNITISIAYHILLNIFSTFLMLSPLMSK